LSQFADCQTLREEEEEEEETSFKNSVCGTKKIELARFSIRFGSRERERD